MALERLGADFEHYRVVEFDKYAIASYNAIHGTDFPTMDITEIKGEDLGIVDTDRFTYLLTHFLAPICQLPASKKECLKAAEQEVVYFGKLKDCLKKLKNYRKCLLWRMYRKYTERSLRLIS